MGEEKLHALETVDETQPNPPPPKEDPHGHCGVEDIFYCSGAKQKRVTIQSGWGRVNVHIKKYKINNENGNKAGLSVPSGLPTHVQLSVRVSKSLTEST